VYDGTTSSSGVVGTSGLVVGDTVGSLTQSYASRNVLGLNGSTLQVNAGYTVNDGNGGANYTVTANTAAGTISPAALAVTANDAARSYGVPNPPFSATYSGFGVGDTAADLLGTLTFSTLAVPSSPPGLYAIDVSGLSSPNYSMTYIPGRLTVTGQGFSLDPLSSVLDLMFSVGEVGALGQRKDGGPAISCVGWGPMENLRCFRAGGQ